MEVDHCDTIDGLLVSSRGRVGLWDGEKIRKSRSSRK